jgi:hypothetical protein
MMKKQRPCRLGRGSECRSCKASFCRDGARLSFPTRRRSRMGTARHTRMRPLLLGVTASGLSTAITQRDGTGVTKGLVLVLD